MRQGKKKRCQSSHIVAYAELQNVQKGGEELNILKANYVIKKEKKKAFMGRGMSQQWLEDIKRP